MQGPGFITGIFEQQNKALIALLIIGLMIILIKWFQSASDKLKETSRDIKRI